MANPFLFSPMVPPGLPGGPLKFDCSGIVHLIGLYRYWPLATGLQFWVLVFTIAERPL